MRNITLIALTIIIMGKAGAQVIPNGQANPSAVTKVPVLVTSTYSEDFPKSFVRTWQPIKPLNVETDIDIAGTHELERVTQYNDGLGRPLQTINWMATLEGRDEISFASYNDRGQSVNNYLPYSYTDNDYSDPEADFKPEPFAEQKNFYKQLFNADANVNGEKFFYSSTAYEASPLDRVVKTMKPGNSWVGADRGNTVTYENNSTPSEVRLWKIGYATGSLPVSSGFYQLGELARLVTTDVNGKRVISYTDEEGKEVLRKVEIAGGSPPNSSGYEGWLCTHYVYDDFGNLRFIIPPKALAQWYLHSTTPYDLASPAYSEIVNELCWRYEYDARQRKILEKKPAAGESYFIYDARNRMVMTQDATIRTLSATKWLVSQYDTQDRLIATYLWSDNNAASYHATQAYNSTVYPAVNASNAELLSQIYYDNYDWVATSGTSLGSSIDNSQLSTDFLASAPTAWPYAQAATQSLLVKGLATGSKVKILGTTNTYLCSVSFYDMYGRVIQTQSINQTGGKDISTMQYSFDGRLLVEKLLHNKLGANAQSHTIITKYKYDNKGRVLYIYKKVDNVPEKKIANYFYDQLGQLKNKTLGENADGYPVEYSYYDYNINGQLQGINKDYAKNDLGADSYFGMELSYDYGFSQSNYTGAISGVKWRSKGDGEQRAYGYSYDAAGRLMKADFTQNNGGWNTSALVDFSVKMGDGTDYTTAYDANGNVKKMQQWGLKVNTSPQIDNLTYTYNGTNQLGNKLLNIVDANNDNASVLGDFKYDPSGKTTADYTYDPAGNLVSDNNKGLKRTSGNGVVYNYLGLVSKVYKSRDYTDYTYSADGVLLSKQSVRVNMFGHETVTSSYTYIEGFVYESNQLQFIQHEEGRMRPTGGGNFAFDYFITDNLGNTRMVLTDEQKTIPYATLSFEGGTGSAEETAQNNIWENSTGTPINIASARIARPGPFYTNTTNGDNAILVRKSTGAIGAGKLLKVMSGDRIHTSVQYYFSTNTASPAATGLSTLTASLAGMLVTSPTTPSLIKGSATAISSAVGANPFAGPFFAQQNATGTGNRPRAFLHVLFFDEQFKFDNSASYFQQIGTASVGIIDLRMANARQAKKNGYCYIYISNETNEMVYFDNLTLSVEAGPILEETHYYPAGLRMAGISSSAVGVVQNKYLYQGLYSEFDDVTGWNNFALRNYDPQTGRFVQQDPYDQFGSGYMGMGNNFVNGVDKDGGLFGFLGIDDLVVSASSFAMSYIAYGSSQGDWGGKALLTGFTSAVLAEGSYLLLGGGLDASPESATAALGGAGSLGAAFSFAKSYSISNGISLLQNYKQIKDASDWGGFGLISSYSFVNALSAGFNSERTSGEYPTNYGKATYTDVFESDGLVTSGIGGAISKAGHEILQSYDPHTNKWDTNFWKVAAKSGYGFFGSMYGRMFENKMYGKYNGESGLSFLQSSLFTSGRAGIELVFEPAVKTTIKGIAWLLRNAGN